MNGFLTVEDIISCNTCCFECLSSARLMYRFFKSSEIIHTVLSSQQIEIILPLFILGFFYSSDSFCHSWVPSSKMFLKSNLRPNIVHLQHSIYFSHSYSWTLSGICCEKLSIETLNIYSMKKIRIIISCLCFIPSIPGSIRKLWYMKHHWLLHSGLGLTT